MNDVLTQLKAIDIKTIVEDLGFTILQHRRIKCPFHDDLSPSLVFYPFPQNEFHCFGCGKHGDGISFYADVNQIDMKAAVKQLAISYLSSSVNVRDKKIKRFEKPDALKPAVLSKANEDSIEIFEAFREFCIKSPKTDSAVRAVMYLRERGIDDWLIRQFQLFVIKDYRATNSFLQTQFSQEKLIASGLMNERGNLIFYRHPLIIPYIQDGRIVYLQGRTIGSPEEGTSKYQFLKKIKKPLFNQDILKKARGNSKIYITEGAFDCISAVGHGDIAVSVGSAQSFDSSWTKLFQRFQVYVWFDNDHAGQMGTIQLMERLHLEGITVHKAYLPEGVKDINEYYLTKRNP